MVGGTPLPGCLARLLRQLACVTVIITVAAARRATPAMQMEGATLAVDANASEGALVDVSGLAGINDPKTVARVIQMGLDAVNEGIVPLQKSPPDIPAALKILDERLWQVVVLANGGQENWDQLEVVKSAWDLAFKDTPDIYKDMNDFHAQGDTDALVRVVSHVTQAGIKVCKVNLPAAVPYLEAIDVMVTRMGKGWGLYMSGNIEDSVAEMWKATQAAADFLLPESLRNHATYQLVNKAADHVIGKLSKHVVDYKKAIATALVCYKRTIQRGKARPKVCRDGFFWDGGYRCLPKIDNGADCLKPCGGKAGDCPDFCGSDRVCCRQGYSSDPEECHGAVGYVDHSYTEGSSWDYHQCVYPEQPDEEDVDEEADHSEDDGVEYDDDDEDEVDEEADTPAPRMTADGVVAAFAAARRAPDDGEESLVEAEGFEEAEDFEGEASFAEVASRRILPSHRRRAANGATVAMCDTSSSYSEKHTNGRYCLTSCPEGFKPVNAESCRTVCGEGTGKFKVDGHGHCSVHAGATLQMFADMFTATLGGALKVAVLVAKIKASQSIDVGDLYETINHLIEAGKSFAKPMCPMELTAKPDQQVETPVLFHVKKCGDKRLNGPWQKDGWRNGRPRYTKVGHSDNIMEWSESRRAWRLYVDETFFKMWGRKTLYISSENSMAFPTDDWAAVKGKEPEPTIRALYGPHPAP